MRDGSRACRRHARVEAVEERCRPLFNAGTFTRVALRHATCCAAVCRSSPRRLPRLLRAMLLRRLLHLKKQRFERSAVRRNPDCPAERPHTAEAPARISSRFQMRGKPVVRVPAGVSARQCVSLVEGLKHAACGVVCGSVAAFASSVREQVVR